jgi:CHAD domain-containing protein
MAKPWKIVDLDPDQSLKICLGKVAQTRFQETFSFEHQVFEGDDIEALHDMRVSARRLRAVLRIFRECFPKKKFKKQDEKLQTLVRSLGAVREHDVFIETLNSYRTTLGTQECKAIDLLIARERTSRSLLRRQMLRHLKLLRRSDYTGSFNQFLRESL